MIAEYFTRRDAEIYASELTQLYGPDVHFDVVGMRDPVFGDTVWYVRGTGAVDGEMFAQYAQEGNPQTEGHIRPAGRIKRWQCPHSSAHPDRTSSPCRMSPPCHRVNSRTC